MAIVHRKIDKLSEVSFTPPQKNDSHFNSTQSWIVFICAGAFYLYEMILRVSPSVMTEELMREFTVTSTTLGVLSSFYYYAYVILQIPCGLIVDWMGTRRVITISSALCTFGMIVFALSDNLWLAQFGRFLIGAGSACAFISCLKVTADWFTPTRFAIMAGITNMMGTFGGMFGGPPLAILVNAYDWKTASFILAGIGVLMTIISWIFIRDLQPITSTSRTLNKGKIELFESLFIIVKSPNVWLIGLIGTLMYMPISAFTELWAVPYLMQIYDIDTTVASMASTMLFIGFAIGGPITAWISDHIKSRLVVMSWSAIGALICFIGIVLIPVPLIAMFSILFLSGVFIGGEVLCFTCVKELFPNKMSGAVLGFTNAVVMLSGVVFQPLLGGLLDLAWDGQKNLEGIPIYSTETYQIAMTAIPLMLGVCWILMLMAKKKRELEGHA